MAISKRLRFEILRRDGHRCFYCHDTERKLTVDHVIPKALGGTDEPTNLVAACGECNGGKSSINPNADLIAQANTDALRWQMAWAAAIAEAEAAGVKRSANIAAIGRRFAQAHLDKYGYEASIPADWEISVGRWLDLGLPVSFTERAISSTMGRANVRAANRWTYFAGCCWSSIREMGDRAKELAADSEQQPIQPDFDRLVVDMAVEIWGREVIGFGREPKLSELEALRNSAVSLYPEKVGSGAILKAAYDVAEWDDTDLSHALGRDDYLDAKPFHVLVAEYYLYGWADSGPATRNPLTPELWQDVLTQALSARDAGYDEDFILQGARFAGQHNDSLTSQMTSASDSFEINREWYDGELKEGALTQDELDQIAEQQWAEKVEHDRKSAGRAAAGDPWYRSHPAHPDNAVTNAVSHETRHADGGA